MAVAVQFAPFSDITAMMVICLLAVAFMVRFLIALLAETGRPKVRMVRVGPHGMLRKVQPIPIRKTVLSRKVASPGKRIQPVLAPEIAEREDISDPAIGFDIKRSKV
ncbi:MAG TPA: hypothetical protein VKW78_07810 [Terriglobales bacterium]|nr:hypothetical protein [Terriglobales bacterium]